MVRGSAAMHSSWIKVYVEDKRTSVLNQVPNSYPAVSFPIHLVLLARDFSFCSSGPLLLRKQCKFSKGWEQVGAEQQCAKPEAAQVPPLPCLLLLPDQTISLQGLPCQGRNQ